MSEIKQKKIRFNLKYFGVFVILFVIEVLIALYIHDDFIRPFVGDVLVVILMYTFIKSFVNRPMKLLPLCLFLFALIVEISQGMGAIETFVLQQNRVARIIMGTTYDKRDVLCYAMGSGILYLVVQKKIEFFLALLVSNALVIVVGVNYILGEMGAESTIGIVVAAIFAIALFICLIVVHIYPNFGLKTSKTRLVVLMGGRKLLRISYGLLVVNTLWIAVFGDITGEWFLNAVQLNTTLSLSINYLFGFIVLLTFYINGYIRTIVTSRRLSPLSRVLAILFMFIPPIQLGFSYYLCRQAMAEYDHESNKVDLDDVRVESQVCQTQYPLLMLHGVGFKDLKYFNYWGRVPNELIKHGSQVYYGHQEAWGTIEDNAAEVKDKILEVIENEGCEKVNIIAHSKGGLDARYVVSQLGMGDYVASLTMISTPHRGSEVLEFVQKLPDKLINIIGNAINRHFRILGDKGPNFHVASKQFLIAYSNDFNERVKDDERVYYQSYATTMKTPISDPLLLVPYCIVRIMGGKNDGLVTTDSAKWGEFKGIVANKYNRGISHGDIIDLKREDYEGFDVREFYVQLVSDLKAKGF